MILAAFDLLMAQKLSNTDESDAFLASCSVPKPQKQVLVPEVNYWSSVNKTQTSQNDEYLKQNVFVRQMTTSDHLKSICRNSAICKQTSGLQPTTRKYKKTMNY